MIFFILFSSGSFCRPELTAGGSFGGTSFDPPGDSGTGIEDGIFEVIDHPCRGTAESSSGLIVWDQVDFCVMSKGEFAEFFGVSVDYLVTGKEYAPAPSQTVNQGIFGDRNHNNTVTINGNAPLEVSEIEGELLKVCASLDIRRKNALLTYAYKLENEMSEG